MESIFEYWLCSLQPFWSHINYHGFLKDSLKFSWYTVMYFVDKVDFASSFQNCFPFISSPCLGDCRPHVVFNHRGKVFDILPLNRFLVDQFKGLQLFFYFAESFILTSYWIMGQVNFFLKILTGVPFHLYSVNAVITFIKF